MSVHKDKKVLGVITARGGSKGIPGKNIKPLLGKPLIAYTIEAAKQSGVFDRLILSTDDSAIAEVAKQYGCDVPFMRPAELAKDGTPHLPVMQHAVSWLREHEGYEPAYVMILQPTSPLRQSFHIKEAVDLILSSGADSVLSVAEVPKNYQVGKLMTVGSAGFLQMLDGSPVRRRAVRRQDFTAVYWSAGIVYLFRTALLFDANDPGFYGERVMPYVVEEKYAVDIDMPADWVAAEEAFKRLRGERIGDSTGQV